MKLGTEENVSSAVLRRLSSFCLLRSRQKEKVLMAQKTPTRDQVVIEARKRAKEMVFGLK